MSAPQHTAHVFSRVVSVSESGMCVYGCSAHPRCVETETRRKGSVSPFALAREAERQRKAGRVPAKRRL